MLMCMELMLNGVTPELVVFAQQQTNAAAATVLVFLVFVVAAAEIAIAIPIVLLPCDTSARWPRRLRGLKG